MGRIGSYASLYYAQDQADPERGRFSQDVSEKLNDIGTQAACSSGSSSTRSRTPTSRPS